MSQEKFAERMHITNQAIAHEEADRIPIWCQYGTTPYLLSDGIVTYRDSMYDHEKAAEAIIKFHQDFQPDAQLANMVSGKIEDIAETAVLDWPGRKGGNVPDESIYQTLEPELMMEDEYDELFGDFTGFLLHKYIPRAFPGLAGLGKVLNPAPTGYMYAGQLANSLFNPDAISAYEKLIEMAKANAECQAAIKKLQGTLFGMGFPPLLTGVGLVPYDTLSNYFRHTVDTFEDLMFQEKNVERAVNFLHACQTRHVLDAQGHGWLHESRAIREVLLDTVPQSHQRTRGHGRHAGHLYGGPLQLATRADGRFARRQVCRPFRGSRSAACERYGGQG